MEVTLQQTLRSSCLKSLDDGEEKVEMHATAEDGQQQHGDGAVRRASLGVF